MEINKNPGAFRIMRKISLLFLFILTLSGCGAYTLEAPYELANERGLSLKGKALHIVQEKPFPFEGSITSMPDPAVKAENVLIRYVIRKYELAGKGETLYFDTPQNPKSLVNAAKQKGLTGLILDVHTYKWNYITGLTFTNGMAYAGRVRLIDIESGNIIASHACNRNSSELTHKSRHEHSKLSSKDKSVLQDFTNELAAVCLTEYKTKAV